MFQKFIVSEASEVERWEAHVRREAPEIFLSCRTTKNFRRFALVPSTFLALQVQSVVLVSASVWSVQFDHFLIFLFFVLSVPPCSVICKSVGTCPRALDGVSVTFVLQFHTGKHYKTAIKSECIVSQGLFSQCLRSKLRTEWYFLLELLTRVATLSGGGHVPQVPQWHDASDRSPNKFPGRVRLWMALRGHYTHEPVKWVADFDDVLTPHDLGFWGV